MLSSVDNTERDTLLAGKHHTDEKSSFWLKVGAGAICSDGVIGESRKNFLWSMSNINSFSGVRSASVLTEE